MTPPGAHYHPANPGPSPAVTAAADRNHAGSRRSVVFGVLTTSDTHTEEDDASGTLVKDLLRGSGHHVGQYGLVANSVADIREAVDRWMQDPQLEAVITIGGTGVSSRDVSTEALSGLGGKVLEGFGDLYRMLSFQEVGALAIMSRASLYAIQNRPVFAVPGSERACRLAVEKLILPSVEHLVEELAR